MTRRVTIAASEALGMRGTGGAATADSLLALALARHGHEVELLVAPGRALEPLAEPWAGAYAAAGVRVTRLEGGRLVRPGYLAPTHAVYEAVATSSPDVVIADDWRGLSWASLCARQVGRALSDTAVVLYCHGPARMLAEFARKVPDTLPRFGEEVAERASLRLADAAVSPSAWLFDWEARRNWPAPRARHVVPCLWRSVALGEEPEQAPLGGRVRRLAFFGQLREGKGVRIFLESLDALTDLLDGVEIAFLGRETPRWTSERVLETLHPRTLEQLGSIRFAADLDPATALADLRAPGTLAVMPSLLDNSPYTVSECLEHGIPFVAARTGGIPELVTDADRERVLFDPSPTALTEALRRALSSSSGHAPATPGFDPPGALATWLDLVETISPHRVARGRRATHVSVVATDASARLTGLGASSSQVDSIRAPTRTAGLTDALGEWVVFLDGSDEPDEALLDALLDAQAATGADIVTTAVRPADAPDGVQLFLGEPGTLGLVENQYGVIALLRRDLLEGASSVEGTRDPDWPLLADLALRGARIVSIPDALSMHRERPGTIADVPGDGLTVLRLFESADAAPRDAAQLAATLAAALERGTSAAGQSRHRSMPERVVAALRADGLSGLVRRARTATRRDPGPHRR